MWQYHVDVDRNDRRDLSIFRMRWDWLEQRFTFDDFICIFSNRPFIWCLVARKNQEFVFFNILCLDLNQEAVYISPRCPPPSSSGLGRGPFKAETGVRTPVGAHHYPLLEEGFLFPQSLGRNHPLKPF